MIPKEYGELVKIFFRVFLERAVQLIANHTSLTTNRIDENKLFCDYAASEGREVLRFMPRPRILKVGMPNGDTVETMVLFTWPVSEVLNPKISRCSINGLRKNMH